MGALNVLEKKIGQLPNSFLKNHVWPYSLGKRSSATGIKFMTLMVYTLIKQNISPKKLSWKDNPTLITLQLWEINLTESLSELPSIKV